MRRIQQRRAMFEGYLLCACVLSGVTGVFLPKARAKSLVEAFPHSAQTFWYFALLVGGSLGLVGIGLKNTENALRIERAAMMLLAGLVSSFALASVGYAGWPAITGAAMLLGFAVAAFFRVLQIRTELKEIEALRANHSAPVNESP